MSQPYHMHSCLLMSVMKYRWLSLPKNCLRSCEREPSIPSLAGARGGHFAGPWILRSVIITVVVWCSVNGLGISIGKLDLYVAGGGFDPAYVLPVVRIAAAVRCCTAAVPRI